MRAGPGYPGMLSRSSNEPGWRGMQNAAAPSPLNAPGVPLVEIVERKQRRSFSSVQVPHSPAVATLSPLQSLALQSPLVLQLTIPRPLASANPSQKRSTGPALQAPLPSPSSTQLETP